MCSSDLFQGMRYSEMIGIILQSAVERTGVTAKTHAVAGPSAGGSVAVPVQS